MVLPVVDIKFHDRAWVLVDGPSLVEPAARYQLGADADSGRSRRGTSNLGIEIQRESWRDTPSRARCFPPYYPACSALARPNSARSGTLEFQRVQRLFFALDYHFFVERTLGTNRKSAVQARVLSQRSKGASSSGRRL